MPRRNDDIHKDEDIVEQLTRIANALEKTAQVQVELLKHAPIGDKKAAEAGLKDAEDAFKDLSNDSPDLIQVDGDTAPWVLEMSKRIGLSEIEDEDELTKFLGVNPNDDDADGVSWCAIYVGKCLTAAGIENPESLSVMDYADFGYDLFREYKAESIPNGAILLFQPKAGKRRISHIGVKVQGNKLLGGNQGDSVKCSNLQWYLNNAELVAARCPNGYELINEVIS